MSDISKIIRRADKYSAENFSLDRVIKMIQTQYTKTKHFSVFRGTSQTLQPQWWIVEMRHAPALRKAGFEQEF